MHRASVAKIIDAGTGADGNPVRLLGHYSRHPKERGLVILFHGWEGSEQSTYVQTTANRLYDRGLSVFRMVYRDHGESHHLNEGIFLAPHFAEVLEATRQAAKLAKELPVYIVGFSLGGNYALRVAARHEQEAIKGLAHVFAISPVIDPLDGAPLVDKFPLIRRYFHRKWTGSLARKQEAFPHLYDFSGMLKTRSILELTDYVLPRYTQFPDRASYFNAYRIKQDALADTRLPVSIITARDDPIIPPSHVEALDVSEAVELIMLDHGGHNGFFDSLRGPAWYERYIWNRLGLDAALREHVSVESGYA